MRKSNSMHASKSLFYVLFLGVFFSACRTTNHVASTDLRIIPVEKSSYDSLLSELPNYSESLYTVSGKGRAIVSEPGNSDRITIEFETDSILSKLTIKNRIGIVGGEILVDQDSILIYNKIDKEARKISVIDGRLTTLNELVSVNLLNLLNYKIQTNEVSLIENHFSSERTTVIYFKTGGYALISESSGLIDYVEKPRSSGLPYAAIRYENYGEIDGYTLPRKITILSADEASKVILQIRSLSVNPDSLNLTLEIPTDIRIQRI